MSGLRGRRPDDFVCELVSSRDGDTVCDIGAGGGGRGDGAGKGGVNGVFAESYGNGVGAAGDIVACRAERGETAGDRDEGVVGVGVVSGS